MKDWGTLGFVSFILVLIGALNVGIFGLLNANIIGFIFGPGFVGRIIYILIGAAAGYLIYIKWIKKEE